MRLFLTVIFSFVWSAGFCDTSLSPYEVRAFWEGNVNAIMAAVGCPQGSAMTNSVRCVFPTNVTVDGAECSVWSNDGSFRIRNRSQGGTVLASGAFCVYQSERLAKRNAFSAIVQSSELPMDAISSNIVVTALGTNGIAVSLGSLSSCRQFAVASGHLCLQIGTFTNALAVAESLMNAIEIVPE